MSDIMGSYRLVWGMENRKMFPKKRDFKTVERLSGVPSTVERIDVRW